MKSQGQCIGYRQFIEAVQARFAKPIIGANYYHVTQGALCAVVKTGQEQGETAARKLVQALAGTEVKNIPIEENYRGRQVINVKVMKALGIVPNSRLLIGSMLVK